MYKSVRGRARRVETVYKSVRGVILSVPSQKSERSCTRVLEVVMLSVPSQQSERSCTRVLEVDILSVPSQKSERSCTRVLEVDICLYQARRVRDRVQEC